MYTNTNTVDTIYQFCTRKRRRWLQDTSKRKLADFWIVFVPPPLPVPPGSPEVDPAIDQNKRAG